ncbi:carboxypeptidase regulatory-like domain-containing protein [bacterium]|nr:carboxypeptidase regulatory-like domain-containing protein [bacterium]
MRIPKGLLALCFALFALSAMAATTTLPIGDELNGLTLTAAEENVLSFRAELGSIEALEVNTPEGLFTRLTIPGFHSSKVEGAPELPQMNRLYEIPFGANTRIEILSLQTERIRLADFGFEHRIMPAQPSMPKSADPSTWPFIYDHGSYSSDRVAYEMVKVVPMGRLRAVDLGRLEVAPLAYFPETGELEIATKIEFELRFEGGDTFAGQDLKAAVHSPFFSHLYEGFAGYRGLHDDYPDRVRDLVTMVIIVPEEFELHMEEFVDWKIRRGFNVIVGVIGSPEVGTSTSSIQAYIHGLYNNGTPEVPAPSFVIFVGDVAQCPTFFESGDATDRPYCDVEGDLVPDIYYGRFSATNPTQLNAILDKTLMYDQFTMPDTSYLGEVVMIAGMDGSFGPTHGNGQINYGTEHYFNEAHGISSYTYLYPASGSNAANIVQNVSDGVGYINYTAHGSQTSWSDPSFTQSNINGLQNYGEYCLAVGNCCLTSTYDYGECFAETWLRAADKGAIGYIGGSNSTYWDEDYWWGVGYHPSSQIDGSAYPYEDTALGVYDGLFHDHGEDMEQWYVTNDAIIFSGNLAVMESGSSRTTYYWNIYNLMGDPSIATYLGVPGPNPVVHPETIFTTWSSIAIDAAPGSYVGLTRDGEILGAGTVAIDGTLDLPVFAAPMLPGAAELVVFCQNYEPYIVDVNVIVPAHITMNPDNIDANLATDVTIGVFEYDGVTPKEGIEVWADGLEYESGHAFTDAAGYATINVIYPYGPSIDVVGQDPAETWELFRDPLTVNADPLMGISLSVSTDIGLSGAFALNLPGTITASGFGGVPAHILYAYQDGVLIDQTTENSLTITPTALGEVDVFFAKDGSNLVTASFEVIEAYGTLTGHVDADGSPAVGAWVRGYDALDVMVFETTTDGAGNYDMGEDIVVAEYDIAVDLFGYLHHEETFFLNYGANTLDVNLAPAPAGVISGTVTDSEFGDPLEATVKVYRTDTGELYAETTSDPGDGSYTTPSLPYFDYMVTVKAWHYIPVTIGIEVDEPVIVKSFVLDPTIGDLLVINDSGKSTWNEAKVDEKSGAIIAEAYSSNVGKACTDIISDLDEIGYTSTMESMGETDPLTWVNYDLVLVSAGDNTEPFGDTSFTNALVDFVEVGGHVLIEGGEVAYDHQSGDFATQVLHHTGWNHDQSGNVTIAEADHYLASVPNLIPASISMSYSGYGDHDAVDVAADAVTVGSWSDYAGDGSIIAYDPNPAPEGGQIVFFAFNYSAMDAAVRPLLLQNAVTWLMTQEVGDCSISGAVTLEGETDYSGVLVEAIPGGGYVYTGADGLYSLPGLYAGGYEIRASKNGFSTEIAEVPLGPGEDATGIDLDLSIVYEATFCSEPGLAINDNTTIDDSMDINLGSTVTDIAVFVDITHTYQGDLIVTLESPEGTSVVLHNRTGGSADNLIGWYPDDMDPAGNLEDFIGDVADGLWTLTISDNAGGDSGTFNEWCLKITYSGDPTDVIDAVPAVLALGRNFPNPFNPKTMIRFDLPKAGTVDLAVYDVTGRRVATLITANMDAGYQEVEWLGRDDHGTPMASGVYFSRLAFDGQVLRSKMLLLK